MGDAKKEGNNQPLQQVHTCHMATILFYMHIFISIYHSLQPCKIFYMVWYMIMRWLVSGRKLKEWRRVKFIASLLSWYYSRTTDCASVLDSSCWLPNEPIDSCRFELYRGPLLRNGLCTTAEFYCLSWQFGTVASPTWRFPQLSAPISPQCKPYRLNSLRFLASVAYLSAKTMMSCVTFYVCQL